MHRDARVPHHCIVIGLGAPLPGDDGVGWHITDKIAPLVQRACADADVAGVASGGLALMERLVGYDRAIIVDAVHTGRAPVGSVHRFRLETRADPTVGHSASANDVSLAAALAAGRALGAHLPTEVTVVAVEVPDRQAFGDGLSPEVAAAVPLAVAEALQVVLHREALGAATTP
jgi:hydrogenase maturation protease